MRAIWIAVGLGIAVSGAQAQSCERADSALGKRTDGWTSVKYDKFTDSTVIFSAHEGDVSGLFSMPGGAETSFRAAYKGKIPTDTAAISGTVIMIAEDARESGVSKYSGQHAQKVDVSMSKYGDVEKVFLLLDDSVRLELPVTHHESHVKQSDGLSAAKVLETLTLTVTVNDLARIGAANAAAMRVGENTKKFSGRVLKSIREQARIVLCLPGNAASSPPP